MQSRTSAQGTGLHTFQMGHPISTNLIKIIPYKHAQRLVSLVILDQILSQVKPLWLCTSHPISALMPAGVLSSYGSG